MSFGAPKIEPLPLPQAQQITPDEPDAEQVARQRQAIDRRRFTTDDLFRRPTETGIKP